MSFPSDLERVPDNYKINPVYNRTVSNVDLFTWEESDPNWLVASGVNQIAAIPIGTIPAVNPTRVQYEYTHTDLTQYPQGTRNIQIAAERDSGPNTGYIGGVRLLLAHSGRHIRNAAHCVFINTLSNTPVAIQEVPNMSYNAMKARVIYLAGLYFNAGRVNTPPTPTPHLGTNIATKDFESSNTWGTDSLPVLRYGSPENGQRPFYLDRVIGDYGFYNGSGYSAYNRFAEDVPDSKTTTANMITAFRGMYGTTTRDVVKFYPVTPNLASRYRRGFTYFQLRIVKQSDPSQYRYINYIVDTTGSRPELVRAYYTTSGSDFLGQFWDYVETYYIGIRSGRVSPTIINQIRVDSGTPVPEGNFQKYGILTPEAGYRSKTQLTIADFDDPRTYEELLLNNEGPTYHGENLGGNNPFNVEAYVAVIFDGLSRLFAHVKTAPENWQLAPTKLYQKWQRSNHKKDDGSLETKTSFTAYQQMPHSNNFADYVMHVNIATSGNEIRWNTTALQFLLSNVEDPSQFASCTAFITSLFSYQHKVWGVAWNVDNAEIERRLDELDTWIYSVIQGSAVAVPEPETNTPIPPIDTKIKDTPWLYYSPLDELLEVPHVSSTKDHLWSIYIGQVPIGLELMQRCVIIRRVNTPTTEIATEDCIVSIPPDVDIVTYDMSNYDEGVYQVYQWGFRTDGTKIVSPSVTKTKDEEPDQSPTDKSDQTGTGSPTQSQLDSVYDINKLIQVDLDHGKCKGVFDY